MTDPEPIEHAFTLDDGRRIELYGRTSDTGLVLLSGQLTITPVHVIARWNDVECLTPIAFVADARWPLIEQQVRNWIFSHDPWTIA